MNILVRFLKCDHGPPPYEPTTHERIIIRNAFDYPDLVALAFQGDSSARAYLCEEVKRLVSEGDTDALRILAKYGLTEAAEALNVV